jgi:hypothetical protein
MDHITHSLRKPTNDLFVAGVSGFFIVTFLFFIDEGYYSFEWMTQPGHWIVFGIYMGIVFPFLWMISYFIFGRLSGWKKLMAVSLSGFVLTLGLVFVFLT